MYDNGYITWGRVDIDVTGPEKSSLKSYRFIVSNVEMNFRKVQLSDRKAFSRGELESKDDEQIVGSKRMRLAFFIEGEDLSQQISFLLDKLIKDVFFEVSMIVILATTIFIIFGVMRVKRLAIKMTAQIIHLYEMLY
mmetsp:Transcript_44007/g.58387  ORF Transcript_44007/g.58387 Transcript_44007/m.58387 type:complete len:137 (+) Transcript_44007:1409-1819(+)